MESKTHRENIIQMLTQTNIEFEEVGVQLVIYDTNHGHYINFHFSLDEQLIKITVRKQ